MEEDLKKKILEAAMELLLERDITKITTREVVKKADVNISLLHYYFKTKNDLFSEALIAATEVVFRKWISENINFDKPEVVDLEKYLGFIVESVSRYPSVSRSQIYMAVQGVDIETFSFGINVDLFTILSALVPECSQSEITGKIHFIGQILISLRVSTSLIMGQTGLDFELESNRKKYTTMLIKQFVPELYR